MKRFMEAIEEEQVQERKQQRLHQKHHIRDENVIVVEKSNMIKFSIRSIAACIHAAASILILLLAAIGLICLIYPDTRAALSQIVGQLHMQIQQYLTE